MADDLEATAFASDWRRRSGVVGDVVDVNRSLAGRMSSGGGSHSTAVGRLGLLQLFLSRRNLRGSLEVVAG